MAVGDTDLGAAPAGVVLGEAGPPDADALMRLEKATCEIALAHIFDPPYPVREVRDRWVWVLADPAARTLVASTDAGPVGYAAVNGRDLCHFGVHPAWYGTDLAPWLLGEAELVMGATGPGPLGLWVLEENHRARRFYAKHGWAPTGAAEPSEFSPFPVQVRYERVSTTARARRSPGRR